MRSRTSRIPKAAETDVTVVFDGTVLVLRVEGKPVSKPNTMKISRRRLYSSDATIAYENLLSLRIKEALVEYELPLFGKQPIDFKITTYFNYKNVLDVTEKNNGDADNWLKAAQDSMNQIVYEDDKRAIDSHASKRNDPQSKTIYHIIEVRASTALAA